MGDGRMYETEKRIREEYAEVARKEEASRFRFDSCGVEHAPDMPHGGCETVGAEVSRLRTALAAAEAERDRALEDLADLDEVAEQRLREHRLAREAAETRAKDAERALRGLRYPEKCDAENGGLARFCDHAAEPCDKCDRVRRALSSSPGET